MEKQHNEAVVVAYGRSAVAKSGKKGALRQMHPVTIGGLTLKGVLEKVPELDPALVEDVIVGCAIPERKQGFNFARLMVARAGLPDSVCGMTVNRFCSSGLQAIALAASQIECGIADVIVAGGVESMTACPVNLDISDTFDSELLAMRKEEYIPMGLTAENVAERYGITRREMEELAVESHRRAAAAQDAGKFDDEIIPLPGVDPEGNDIVFDKDQGIRRDTNLETLASMKPCFKENGRVTAATSSQTSDAAAFVVLMSRSKAEELGIPPVAVLEGYAVAGCEPDYMGLGPIYAVPKVMKKTGLTVSDMAVVELNEAFAAQAIPCMRKLGLDPAKTNPNGGAMALGHPQGPPGPSLPANYWESFAAPAENTAWSLCALAAAWAPQASTRCAEHANPLGAYSEGKERENRDAGPGDHLIPGASVWQRQGRSTWRKGRLVAEAQPCRERIRSRVGMAGMAPLAAVVSPPAALPKRTISRSSSSPRRRISSSVLWRRRCRIAPRKASPAPVVSTVST